MRIAETMTKTAATGTAMTTARLMLLDDFCGDNESPHASGLIPTRTPKLGSKSGELIISIYYNYYRN